MKENVVTKPLFVAFNDLMTVMGKRGNKLYSKRPRERSGEDEVGTKGKKKRMCAIAIAVDDDILPSTSDISRVLNSLGLHAHALVSDSPEGEGFQHGGGSEKDTVSSSLPSPLALSIFLPFPLIPLFSRSLTNRCHAVACDRVSSRISSIVMSSSSHLRRHLPAVRKCV